MPAINIRDYDGLALIREGHFSDSSIIFTEIKCVQIQFINNELNILSAYDRIRYNLFYDKNNDVYIESNILNNYLCRFIKFV